MSRLLAPVLTALAAAMPAAAQQNLGFEGSVLLLTVSAYADRTGRVYGGVVEPDEAVEPGAPGTPLADDPTVRAALTCLGTACVP